MTLYIYIEILVLILFLTVVIVCITKNRSLKLWFKIFISTLFLIIAAINITAAFVMSNNQSLMLNRERNRAKSYHYFVCASIENNITYERLKTDVFILSEEKTEDIIESVLYSRFEDNISAAIYDQSGNVILYGDENLDTSSLYESLNKESDIVSGIIDAGERSYICVGSVLNLENRRYTVFTASDITDIYRERDRELIFVQIMSVVFASAIAVILLVIIKVFFRPLNRINDSIKKIAQGDYSLRLETMGSDEFRSLAENINIMSASVEENYRRIENIAEERKRFIDSLSHEIKTPLTSILGFADILRIKRDITPQELNEYSSIIVEESKRLRSLSGKLMEIVSSSNNQLTLTPVNADEILGELKTVFAPIAKVKNLEFVCKLEPVTVKADSDIFKSLIYNLIDNAVKASNNNSKIELICKSEGEYAVITVRDYGIGISEEDKKRVFEPFYMSDKSRSRKQGGAGLGLALCTEIAKKHNAVIKLESEIGKGTAVSVKMKRIGGTESDENKS